MSFSLFFQQWQGPGAFLFFLLFLSLLVSWILIIERCIYFYSKKARGREALQVFQSLLADKDAEKLEKLSLQKPIFYVLKECLSSLSSKTKNLQEQESFFEETKSRAIAEKIPEMERYLNIQGSLGTVSPYIGLLGTVFGIIRSFTGLAVYSKGEAAMAHTMQLHAGIAEALIATAAGLVVAIPASIAYNSFRKAMQGMLREIEIAASHLKKALLQS